MKLLKYLSQFNKVKSSLLKNYSKGNIVPNPHSFANKGLLSIHTHAIPGVKCPNCLAKGKTVWVIPGKNCPQCGTPCGRIISIISIIILTFLGLYFIGEPHNLPFVLPELKTDKICNPAIASLTSTLYEFKDSANSSPLDQFNIRNLLNVEALDGFSISLTNQALYLILASLIVTYLSLILNNYNKLVSNNSSASQESMYATIHSIVVGQINDKKGQMFFPFIFVLFTFILSNNLIGMIPYSFASTSHFILTFSLSFTVVIGATYLGFYLHLFKFFSLLVPSGCPLALLFLLVLIEFISYLARPVSLGLRLAANVLSGHMLLNILSGFTYNIMNSGFFQFFLAVLPLAFVIAFSGLELGIAFIQAQVFVVLSCSYIKDGLSLH